MKVLRAALLWIIALTTLASSASLASPLRSPSASGKRPGPFDPLAAMARSPFYVSDPAAGQPVTVAGPRADVPAKYRTWTIMWVSRAGRLCATVVYPSGLDDSLCHDPATQLAPSKGRVMSLDTVADTGYLHGIGIVRSDVATVIASTGVAPDQIATVVPIPLKDIRVFALTLYAPETSLGDITWTFRDARGSVIASEVTDEWGALAN